MNCDDRVAVRVVGILNSLFPMDYRAGRSLSKRRGGGGVLFGTGSVLDLNFGVQSFSPGFPGRYSLF